MSVPECFPIPGSGNQVHCTLSLSILINKFLLGICIPFTPCSITVDVVGYTLVVSFWGLCEHGSLSLFEVHFSIGSIGKSLGGFLNVVTWLTLLIIDMVLYLCVLRLSTLVTVFGIFPLLGSHEDVLLVHPL